MNKCPFCLEESALLLVDVDTMDCVRVAVTCENCGLTGPGAEDNDNKLAIQFWNELSKTMLPIWNPNYE